MSRITDILVHKIDIIVSRSRPVISTLGHACIIRAFLSRVSLSLASEGGRVGKSEA